jgi:hypothetical protein
MRNGSERTIGHSSFGICHFRPAPGFQHSRDPPTFAIYDRPKFLHCASETKAI